MVRRTVNQTRGRIGELTVVLELERHGISCVDMTSQDYGLDVIMTLPTEPLCRDLLDAISTGPAATVCEDAPNRASWKMSATTISLQIKSGRSWSLTTRHLRQWAAANERRPGTCFVVFLRSDGMTILDPAMINSLLHKAVAEEASSISARKAEGRQINFGFQNPQSRIGEFFHYWACHGEALVELPAYRTALPKGEKISQKEAEEYVTMALLINHLDDDLLQEWANLPSSELLNEVQELVDAITPSASLDPDLCLEELVENLASAILDEHTWLDGSKREKAFNRYNRSLPALFPGEIEAFARAYADEVLGE